MGLSVNYNSSQTNNGLGGEAHVFNPDRRCTYYTQRLRLVFNPKGVVSIAQGWRFAYPGKASKMIFNPEGVAACFMSVLASKGINHQY
jgi:hypothetical protein